MSVSLVKTSDRYTSTVDGVTYCRGCALVAPCTLNCADAIDRCDNGTCTCEADDNGGTVPIVEDLTYWDGEYLHIPSSMITVGDRVIIWDECTITVTTVDTTRDHGLVWVKGEGTRWHRLGRSERVTYVTGHRADAPNHCSDH